MGKKSDDARQTATADRGKGRVSAAQVAEYLRQHPEFLVRHPDLLDIQIVPGRRRAEGVVDLQQFMVERLRRDMQRLKADQDDLLTNSRDNLSTQDRIHKAALALLGRRASRTSSRSSRATDLACCSTSMPSPSA
jgi:uncharacterized protein YigA (DUF484 family)